MRVNKSENINVAGFPDLLPGLKVGENGTFEAWTYKTGLTEHFQIKRGLSMSLMSGSCHLDRAS